MDYRSKLIESIQNLAGKNYENAMHDVNTINPRMINSSGNFDIKAFSKYCQNNSISEHNTANSISRITGMSYENA